MKVTSREFNSAMAWVLLFSGIAVLATAPLESASEPVERPNVLLIMVDDLGYGDLSSYGAGDLRTPNIDNLIGSGLRFDSFYANSPVCSPTRASLLTGLYPDMAGVPGVIRTNPKNSWGDLRTDVQLLSEVLSSSGYVTALIGKWHLGLESPNTPTERGFQFFKGFLGDMMDDYFNHRRHGINYMRENLQEIDPQGHATDLFTDWACEFLAKQQQESAPFFLFLSYNAPHFPVQPPEKWIDRYREWESLNSKDRTRLCAFIEHLDSGIGKVMACLDQTGLSPNTLVIFTSDNGGLLRDSAHNGPYRSGKQLLFEGGVRVPTAIRWPGRIAPGSETQQAALTMDLFPTIIEAAGARIPAGVDGISLISLLLDAGEVLPDRDMFYSRRERSILGISSEAGVTIYAIRRGPWKLLEPKPGAVRQLFNLASDPMERHNLAKSEPELYAELDRALNLQIEKYSTIPWKKQRND